MKSYVIKKIANDYGFDYRLEDDKYFLNNTEISVKTCNENGDIVREYNPDKFPKKINTKYIVDCVDAGLKDLGEVNVIDWKNMNDELFSVIDIETTGTSLEKGGRIIELAAVKIKPEGDSFTVVDEFSQLVNPDLNIPISITKLTSITNTMVKDMPYIENCLQDYFRFISGTTVVGHNIINFDWGRFLLPLFGTVGINVPQNYPILDTLLIDKLIYPDEKKHGLEALCKRYNISNKNHHRAIADVYMNAEGFIHLREESRKYWENKSKPIWSKNGKRPEVIYKVSKTSPWEYRTPRGILRHKRLYVDLFVNEFPATIWYDYIKKTWSVKEYSGNIIIDFTKVGELVLNE